MDFTLPEEHRMIRDSVREFCDAEVAPIAQEIEDEHRFPAEVFDRLAELDVMGVPIDEKWGGLGGDQLMYALVTEELGRVSGAVGLSYAAHVSLGAKPIELFGTDEQREQWLRPLATGEHLGAWALTEPGSGSDASDMDTTARKEGDEWVLNGTKQFITNANVAGSVLVKAVTEPDGGYGAISTFVVDPADDGFEVSTVWDKMGLNASPTCEIRLNDVRVPADRLLGDPGDGWDQTRKTLDGGRVSIAALSVGLAQGAFEAALSYAKEREQFGQPIGEFDAVRDMLVAMDRKIERARLLTQKAAIEYDRGGEDLTRLSSMAKLDASEISREVAEDAVQVLGGYGYTTDFAPQRFFRDAKLMEIGEGTSEIQRLVLGRELGL
ncbi:acyl-CoA dehydrogenase [Halobacteriales archaeon QS_5_68_33]|nr:MAG: acyl-CoA dehydrogenase [Halobacteriales archaeon QS_5_68_33]